MGKKVHEYEGEALKVTWDEGLCIHAGACVRGEPGVFKPGEKPWVQVDAAAAEGVTETIRACPTGALQYEWKGEGQAEEADAVNTVRLMPNGPLNLRGDIEVQNPEGEVIHTATRMSLCRCGASANKPFCDLSHREAGFRDDGKMPGGKQEELGSGKLVVKMAADGPLIFSGGAEIHTSAGDCAARQERGALCRCGESANKPFCDGAHKTAGFQG